MHTKPLTLSRWTRGGSLIEVLVGLLLLSLGLMGATRLQSALHLHSDVGHQRLQALSLAQQDLEGLRGTSSAAAYAAIASHRSQAEAAGTRFTLARDVSTSDGIKAIRIVASWSDRGGGTQTMQLRSALANVPPVYSAALDLPSRDHLFGARRNLPVTAGAWPDDRSVFKPAQQGSVAWIIHSSTGEVRAQCTVPAAIGTPALTPAHLSQCVEMRAALVHGYIRFSLGPAPDAAHPRDAPLPLQLTPGTCTLEPVTRGREPHLAYVCLVPLGEPGSQALQLVPEGWSLGATAGSFKVCRYIDAPRNYLVVRGDVSCPASETHHNEGSHATAQYQP